MSVAKRFPLTSESRAPHAAAAARRFAPGLWPTVAAFFGLLVLLGLGTWQVERLQWKEALIAERRAGLAAPVAPLPVTAEDWR